MLDDDTPGFPIEVPTGERRAALIGAITAEARRRRARRRWSAAVVGGGVMAAVLVAAALAAPSKGARVTTASQPDHDSSATTSSTQALTSTTAADAPAPTVTTTMPPRDASLAGDSEAEPTPATSPPELLPLPTTPPTTIECLNSVDPACGPLVWVPDPGPNAPLELSVSYSPENPVTGEEITFTITTYDPDAHESCLSLSYYGWSCLPRPTCEWKTRYGPWQTPSKPLTQPSVSTRQYTFAIPGTYQIEVQAYSGAGDGCLGNTPWDSQASTTITIVVS